MDLVDPLVGQGRLGIPVGDPKRQAAMTRGNLPATIEIEEQRPSDERDAAFLATTTLIPDKLDDDDTAEHGRGAFLTTLVAFFLVACLLAAILFAGWGLYWGGFPEFSEVGLI